MKKLKNLIKENKVESALYGTTLFWVMELLVTGTIFKEYDKGGNIESLKNKVLKRD